MEIAEGGGEILNLSNGDEKQRGGGGGGRLQTRADYTPVQQKLKREGGDCKIIQWS